MKRAKEFNNILNDCLERLLVKGETLEQCLASYPEQAVELKPLLETALTTKRASTIKPHPEFRARARYQFRAALQEIKPKRGFFPLAWPRWATVVAVVLVLVLAGGSTVAAAGNSMPDGFLYPVKLATEQAQLTLTPSNISKAELYAKLADRRVAEIVYIANRDKPEQLEQTTQRLDTCLAMIAILARAQAKEETEGLAPAPAKEETEGLAPSPAKEETEVLAPAPAKEETEGLAPAPVPSPAPEPEREKSYHLQDKKLARLRMEVARNAINHPEALRAVLQIAPESAKPALRRAIATAEDRYQQALEAVDD